MVVVPVGAVALGGDALLWWRVRRLRRELGQLRRDVDAVARMLGGWK